MKKIKVRSLLIEYGDPGPGRYRKTALQKWIEKQEIKAMLVKRG